MAQMWTDRKQLHGTPAENSGEKVNGHIVRCDACYTFSLGRTDTAKVRGIL